MKVAQRRANYNGEFAPIRGRIRKQRTRKDCKARSRARFEPWECASMGESGQRKLGGNVRMGLEIDAVKEIEELKNEIATERPAGGDVLSGGDSIGISLLDLAEILDQHKMWVESG